MTPGPHRIALLGFGNVGGAFARLRVEHHRELVRNLALDARVVAILTANHGRLVPGESRPAAASR